MTRHRRVVTSGLLAVAAIICSTIASLEDEAAERCFEDETRPRLFVRPPLHTVITAVGFTPDNRRLVTGCLDGTVRFWDLVTWRETAWFRIHSGEIYSIAASPDTTLMLTVGVEGAVVWDAVDGEVLRRFPAEIGWSNGQPFSPKAQRVLTRDVTKSIHVWDLKTGKPHLSLEGFSGAYSPDGKTLIVGGNDGAKLLDAETGAAARILIEGQQVNWVAFARHGNCVMAGTYDYSPLRRPILQLQMFDAKTGYRILALSRDAGAFLPGALAPDGSTLLWNGPGLGAALYSIPSGKTLFPIPIDVPAIRQVAYSPSGRLLAICSPENAVTIWEVATGKGVYTLRVQSGLVHNMTFSPDGCQWLIAARGQPVRLWKPDGAAPSRQLDNQRDYPGQVAFSPDGKKVMVVNWYQPARVWDTSTGLVTRNLAVDEGSAGFVAISADSKRSLTAGDDGIRLWDLATGNEIRHFASRGQGVGGLAFSPDGDQALIGCGDTATLIDLASGQERRDFSGHEHRVCAVAFSADGKHVLTGSMDQTAALWDATTGARVRQFRGHKLNVTSVAFSADGRRILTGSHDSTRLWDAATGEELRVFQPPSNSGFLSTALVNNGKHVLLALQESTAKLMDSDTGRELCCVHHFRDGNWIVIDSDGRLDASSGGNFNEVHWVVGDRTFGLTERKDTWDRYYDPGLLAKYLGFNKQPLRELRAK
jgi:WD40 repeat protein